MSSAQELLGLATCLFLLMCTSRVNDTTRGCLLCNRMSYSLITGISTTTPNSTFSQAYVPANMSMGQIAVFQHGMAQVRPSTSAGQTTNSQTLQNMQLQFQQQMNALMQQQQQQQHALQYGGQTNPMLAVQQNQQWAMQAAAQQHGPQAGSGGDPPAFRRIGPSGTLSGGAGQGGSIPGMSSTVSLFMEVRVLVLNSLTIKA
jgi:hypothetical protein